MKSIITSREIYRGPRWLWWWRLICLISFVPPTIYFTVKLAQPLMKLKCKMSMEMDMHLAIGAATILLYTYTLFATGWTKWLRILPFNWYLQLFIEVALIALWGYAFGNSQMDCKELCHACAAHFLKTVNVNGHNCHCTWEKDKLKHAGRDLSLLSMSPLEKRKGGSGHGGGGGKGGKGKGKGGDGTGTEKEFGNKAEEARYIIDLIMVIALGTLLFMYIAYIPWGKVNKQARGEVDYEEAKAEDLEEMGLRPKSEETEEQVPLKEGTYDTPDHEQGKEEPREEEKGKNVPEVRVQEVDQGSMK